MKRSRAHLLKNSRETGFVRPVEWTNRISKRYNKKIISVNLFLKCSLCLNNVTKILL